MPILIAFETTFAQYPESLAQVFRLAGCLTANFGVRELAVIQ